MNKQMRQNIELENQGERFVGFSVSFMQLSCGIAVILKMKSFLKVCRVEKFDGCCKFHSQKAEPICILTML